MIETLEQCEPASLQGYPVCIIGAGAAGISLAVALSRQGQRVLLIDAGDWKESASLEDAYAGDAQAPHPATTEYRRQRFGGTTHLWGGRCVPLDPLDFAARPGVQHSGWPLSYDDYQGYIAPALAYCDAGDADFSVASLAGATASMFAELPQLQPDLVEHIERYSLPTDFAAKFGAELKRSTLVKVLLKARCLRLNVSLDGAHIESVLIGDAEQQFEIRADTVVLCGGGLEATRLLLCTRGTLPAWQRFDASLGHFYGCHYDMIFGELTFTGPRPWFNFQKTRDGVYARRKLQFSAELQQRQGLLNAAFRLHFPAYADPAHGSGVLSTIYLAKSVLAAEHQSILNHGQSSAKVVPRRSAHLLNVATDAGAVLSFGWDWLFKRKLAKRKLPYTLIPNRRGGYPLEFNSEQVPDAGNRVALAPGVDALGTRRISVHWKLQSADIESGIQSFQHLRALLSRTQSCRLGFDEIELREQCTQALPVGGHHLGSTRMGRTAQDSVVDANCRVHGVENLFVVSSSVFPTYGHANPTLSIVALALRLAKHMEGRHVRAEP